MLNLFRKGILDILENYALSSSSFPEQVKKEPLVIPQIRYFPAPLKTASAFFIFVLFYFFLKYYTTGSFLCVSTWIQSCT
ncbi:hypothetical protein TorRG33x02_064580 [Trema orientale]|uniref:Uncharacterized protein n=1 Tax=Trema orientale TaxID=63057 RepID=A0A2P5FJ94_TREOI|nr:hypothetical protein TorRG33x02_064580 [Trema orientale]